MGVPRLGLTEEEAFSTIIRGFLNVKTKGLPTAQEEGMEHAIQKTGKGLRGEGKSNRELETEWSRIILKSPLAR